MHKTLESRIESERTESGVDIVLVKTGVADMVTARVALGLGAFETYDRRTVATHLSHLLPGGMKGKTRTAVRESFELLGADVSVGIGDVHLYATLTGRKETFIKAFSLLLRTISTPLFTAREFTEAHGRIKNSLEHEREDTDLQAMIALARAQYAKGHPHWSPSTQQSLRELPSITLHDVSAFHKNILTSIGGLVVIGGDINPRTFLPAVRDACAVLPTRIRTERHALHVDRTIDAGGKDLVIPMKDKMNVDTHLSIPLALTRDHTDFEALGVGVAILGGSSSGRLFNELRTRRSLTYGAYASLGGFENGHPGYLHARAIFPNDVFSKGRAGMRELTKQFIEKGVTANELKKRKEEIAGRYTVGLSTTRSMCGAVFGTLLEGKPVSHIDEYPERIRAFSVSQVNRAIRTHLAYDRATTAASGAITKEGTPHTRA